MGNRYALKNATLTFGGTTSARSVSITTAEPQVVFAELPPWNWKPNGSRYGSSAGLSSDIRDSTEQERRAFW